MSAPSPRAARVVIVGAAGFTNLGDDAILAAMLGELRRELPDATLVVSSGSPERLDGIEGVEGIAFDDGAVADALDGADLMIVGGGGFVYDNDARLSLHAFRCGAEGNFYPYFRRAELAYARGVPVHFYGIGVGPLVTRGGREAARAVLSKASAITVRDPISLLELKAAGIFTPRPELTADPAVGLPPPTTAWPERPDGVAVAFVTQSWPWFDDRPTASGTAVSERYLDWLAAGADHAVERWDAQLVFLPVQRLYDDDLAIEEQVVDRMRHGRRAALHQPEAYEQLQAVLAGVDAVVSTRLHPLILAAGAGTPLIGITSKPKVRGFLCSLVLSELAVSPWVASPRLLANAIDRALTEPDVLRVRLQEGMASQRAAAARNPAVAAALALRA